MLLTEIPQFGIETVSGIKTTMCLKNILTRRLRA